MALVERLQAQMARLRSKGELFNKSLYVTWFSERMPITKPRNLTSDLIDGYLNNELVYSIVNKIAETASSIPIQLIDKNNKVIENHWAVELLKNPNDDNSIKDLIFNYYIYLLSIGNSFIYGPKIGNGKVTELWTMPSDQVEILTGTFYQPISGYKFQGSNQETEFPKETVLHGKLFNPRFLEGSWVYGLSPIEVASEIIQAINSGTTALESAFQNMGPPYIISSQTAEGLSQEQQEQLEQTYKKKYGSPQTANAPMLTGTPVKVERIGISPVDLNIIESSMHGTRVLCNVYGVSSIMFNDNENSTYNNVSQARKDFYQYTIQPLNEAFAMKLKQFLIPGEDLRFKFNYDNVEVLQESIWQKSEALNNIWYLTPNQKLEILGFEKSMEPEMDRIFKPMGLEILGENGDDNEELLFLNKYVNNGKKQTGKVEL